MKTSLLRQKSKHFVDLLAKPFVLLKIHPNILSFLSLLSALLVFYSLYINNLPLTAVFILLNGLFDLMDGSVARALKVDSLKGKFIDRLIDKISDALIISAFIVFGLVNLNLGLFVLITVLIATIASANAEAVLNLKISDAFSMRAIRIIISFFLVLFNLITPLFWIMALISIYSLIERIYLAIKSK